MSGVVNAKVIEKLWITEIINDLHRHGFASGGKAQVMLHEWAAELREIWRKLGYDLQSLETRVRRQFGILSILGLNDGKKIHALLNDLKNREKARVNETATGA
jgi:hypothetical protein